MVSSQEIVDAALSPINDEELRTIIECELADIDYATTDIRLMLAADLICDAALEVLTQFEDGASIQKTFTATDAVNLEFPQMSVVGALESARQNGTVSIEELQALLVRSSLANAISNALASGYSAEDLANSKVTVSSNRVNDLMERKGKPRGFLKRLFCRD